MGFSPVIANKDHFVLLALVVWDSNRKVALRVLMDQCSRHDTPSVLTATLTNQPGHGLEPEVKPLNVQVLTGRRLGHHTATAKRSPRDGPPLEWLQARYDGFWLRRRSLQVLPAGGVDRAQFDELVVGDQRDHGGSVDHVD